MNTGEIALAALAKLDAITMSSGWHKLPKTRKEIRLVINTAFNQMKSAGTKLELEEGDRQLVLLALAVLSLRSPGFDDALNRIAVHIDNVSNGRAQIYDKFRETRADIELPVGHT